MVFNQENTSPSKEDTIKYREYLMVHLILTQEMVEMVKDHPLMYPCYKEKADSLLEKINKIDIKNS